MDGSLLDIVLSRLEDKPLAEPAADLLLAALDSDESLSAWLDYRENVVLVVRVQHFG